MTDLVRTIRDALEFHREHAGDPSVSWHDETVTQWLSQAADEIEEMDRFIKMLLVYPNIKETIGLDMYDWAEHVVRREPVKETP